MKRSWEDVPVNSKRVPSFVIAVRAGGLYVGVAIKGAAQVQEADLVWRH